MFHCILVPTDGSAITAKAADKAIELARLTGATLHALAVREPFPFSAVSEMQPAPPAEFYEAQERIANQRVAAVCTKAAAAGVRCETHSEEALQPWEAIVNAAKAHGCDLIVMASHGRRGVSALLLGSETQRVLTHTSVPVLVVR
ncbi:universal stress protein [Aquabacterium sp. J223]|uniref:universal stress protein n=1 Tax=Aquabacterium sp. J223 TaxID=2898431 RepID=UPI0021AD5CC1|nr:universal stress protein [Aquabacterium sp. J223]UUX94089.1 universal stress protein [Aquabacterium sp. J223]